jgi:hypothetical protein
LDIILIATRSAEQALGLGITSADDEVLPTTITYPNISDDNGA